LGSLLVALLLLLLRLEASRLRLHEARLLRLLEARLLRLLEAGLLRLLVAGGLALKEVGASSRLYAHRRCETETGRLCKAKKGNVSERCSAMRTRTTHGPSSACQ
jgi:hypothetical protein